MVSAQNSFSGSVLVAVLDADNFTLVHVNEPLELLLIEKHNGDISKPLLITHLFDECQCQRLHCKISDIVINPLCSNNYIICNLNYEQEESAMYRLYINKIKNEIYKSNNFYELHFVPDFSKFDAPVTSTETRELALNQLISSGFGTFEKYHGVNYIFCSESVYKLLDIDDHNVELNIEVVKRFIHPDEAERMKIFAREINHMKAFKTFECKIITAKKNIKTVEITLKAIYDRSGKFQKTIGAIKDISGNHNIKQRLEKKIEQLHLSNKELEEFAYIASHDLQEPLRKITTYISRLATKYHTLLDVDGAMYIDRITVSAEDMRILINDLLEFSRISNTQQPVKPVDLNFILKQVRADLEIIIEDTGTTIACSALPVVSAISSQMKQLFLNILANAIKFRDPKRIPYITIDFTVPTSVELKKYDIDSSKSYFKIVFTDNGIGFEEEYAQKIFQVFKRLHGKSEYPGSGVGLSICKKIVEHHKGFIFAESIVGAGSRFSCFLPQ